MLPNVAVAVAVDPDTDTESGRPTQYVHGHVAVHCCNVFKQDHGIKSSGYSVAICEHCLV